MNLLTTLLLFLPLPLALASPTCPPNPVSPATTSNNYTVPDGCCCLSYKPACTKNTERLYHAKLFYDRKPGITPEQFNDYWANKHAELARDFHLRIGVVKYAQYHSTPAYRDLLRIPGGPTVLEFDGAAEFWVPDLETLQAMSTDPEYVEKIQPDEANFIDHTSMRMILGVDYIVVENQNAVLDHGRTFPAAW